MRILSRGMPPTLFQSLKGFKVDFAPIGVADIALSGLFQSLKGFKVDFAQAGIRNLKCISLFQSLKGFKVDFAGTWAAARRSMFKVSIPERV